LLFAGLAAKAHSVRIEFSSQYPVVSLRASFSPSSPIKNAEVKIFTPSSDDIFQTGTTDPDGNFSFKPNVTGSWKVSVDDGRGHRRTSEVLVSEAFFKGEVTEQADKPKAESVDEGCAHSQLYEHEHEHSHIEGHHHDHEHIPLVFRIIFGLSVIFGITGIWYGVKARKK